MKYYRIIIHYQHNDSSTMTYCCDLEKYKNEYELIDDVKLCLDNHNIAYIHYQEITFNVFKQTEVKTMNDYSFGNNNQKLYTKYNKFVRNTDYLKSFVV